MKTDMDALFTLIRETIVAANNAGYQDARYISGDITKAQKDEASRVRDEMVRKMWDDLYGHAAEVRALLPPF